VRFLGNENYPFQSAVILRPDGLQLREPAINKQDHGIIGNRVSIVRGTVFDVGWSKFGLTRLRKWPQGSVSAGSDLIQNWRASLSVVLRSNRVPIDIPEVPMPKALLRSGKPSQFCARTFAWNLTCELLRPSSDVRSNKSSDCFTARDCISQLCCNQTPVR